jgi:hypothetical protein
LSPWNFASMALLVSSSAFTLCCYSSSKRLSICLTKFAV